MASSRSQVHHTLGLADESVLFLSLLSGWYYVQYGHSLHKRGFREVIWWQNGNGFAKKQSCYLLGGRPESGGSTKGKACMILLLALITAAWKCSYFSYWCRQFKSKHIYNDAFSWFWTIIQSLSAHQNVGFFASTSTSSDALPFTLSSCLGLFSSCSCLPNLILIMIVNSPLPASFCLKFVHLNYYANAPTLSSFMGKLSTFHDKPPKKSLFMASHLRS